MLEQELFRGEDAPEEVFDDLAFFGGGGFGEEAQEALLLAVVGETCEGGEVGGVDDLGVGGAGLDELRDAAVLRFEFLLDRLAVREVEDLRHARFVRAFAGAGEDSFGAAEGVEEVAGDVGVGELDGARAGGLVLECGGDSG